MIKKYVLLSALMMFSGCADKVVSIPSELKGDWIILTHMPIQGSLQEGIEIDSSVNNGKAIHQLKVGRGLISEVHLRPDFQESRVTNKTYKVLEVTEANGIWRIQLQQLLPNGKVDEDLSERYIQQHIELLFQGTEAEWRFYYDTWEYQVYYCIRQEDSQKYPVFDWSKDVIQEIIPGPEKVYD